MSQAQARRSGDWGRAAFAVALVHLFALQVLVLGLVHGGHAARAHELAATLGVICHSGSGERAGGPVPGPAPAEDVRLCCTLACGSGSAALPPPRPVLVARREPVVEAPLIVAAVTLKSIPPFRPVGARAPPVVA